MNIVNVVNVAPAARKGVTLKTQARKWRVIAQARRRVPPDPKFTTCTTFTSVGMLVATIPSLPRSASVRLRSEERGRCLRTIPARSVSSL